MRITCSKCGKPSYAGCGRHVEQVSGTAESPIGFDPKCQRLLVLLSSNAILANDGLFFVETATCFPVVRPYTIFVAARRFWATSPRSSAANAPSKIIMSD